MFFNYFTKSSDIIVTQIQKNKNCFDPFILEKRDFKFLTEMVVVNNVYTHTSSLRMPPGVYTVI